MRASATHPVAEVLPEKFRKRLLWVDTLERFISEIRQRG